MSGAQINASSVNTGHDLQGRVSSTAAAYLLNDNKLQNSDLEPGKYEGSAHA